MLTNTKNFSEVQNTYAHALLCAESNNLISQCTSAPYNNKGLHLQYAFTSCSMHTGIAIGSHLRACSIRAFSIFLNHTPIPAKLFVCSIWSRSTILGSTESEHPGHLIVNLFSKNSHLCDHNPVIHQRYRRTDRRTDDILRQYRALRSIAR